VFERIAGMELSVHLSWRDAGMSGLGRAYVVMVLRFGSLVPTDFRVRPVDRLKNLLVFEYMKRMK
jgi:hypothetical protein